MRLIWTKHAEDRQQAWQKTLGITRQEIEELVTNPPQIAPGEGTAFVAQAQRGSGLLRVPFVDVHEGRKIITVYWTSKMQKYWQGSESQ